MLDPYWLGGMERHVKRIDLQMLILLTADPLAEPVKKLEAEQALTILSQGASSGPSLEAQAKNQPFYNPHLIVKDELRLKQHQERYLKLLQMVNVFQINTAGHTAAQIAERILYILGSES